MAFIWAISITRDSSPVASWKTANIARSFAIRSAVRSCCLCPGPRQRLCHRREPLWTGGGRMRRRSRPRRDDVGVLMVPGQAARIAVRCGGRGEHRQHDHRPGTRGRIAGPRRCNSREHHRRCRRGVLCAQDRFTIRLIGKMTVTVGPSRCGRSCKSNGCATD